MTTPFALDPLMLTVAPNGAYKTHEQHPALPLTAQALAATAKACLEAGAAMLHMHVRRPDGRHLLDAQAYREATAAVRQAVGSQLVVQITTEAAKIYEPAAQMAVVREVLPEAVSVALRELHVPCVREQELSAFFQWLVAHRVMTQVILYDAADVRDWQDLCRRGVIPEGPWFLLFVLGRYSAGQTSSPNDLLPFLQAHDGMHPWAVCAFGAQEHACVLAAAALGGHVRVGFENNLWLRDGRMAPDNAALVAQAAEGIRWLGRPLATADQVRERFGRVSASG
ncbi:MAG: 3-keto-5-aminohexanoate cleavage protein [Caldimonas sp.]|uniref:3-keto-5-aminohexanoate cleavage protein n=1 Tax=Caldimonas manganoxidans TaxID=196015 RepID=UPI000376AF87|nr:3-keto-5-aminohexanoate cleavage protein [Caldimonas manganoxidans]GIX22922.1 MAG: 3-keto-5-aminohexanoate cleavage protein [Caldimonas sp.]